MTAHTIDTWNQILPSQPSAAVAEEYVWTGASNNDVPLVRAVLEYAKANEYLIDTTHAVHLSCVYNHMHLLDVLEQYHPLNPHYVMTGLYSASSGSQSEVLKRLLSTANIWGHDFYQHIDVNELMKVICAPGNVSENQVLECIKVFEPLFDNPEYSKQAISLANFNYPIAAGYLLKYSNPDVLDQHIKDVEQSSPHQAQRIKDVLLREKLTRAAGESSLIRSHKKI